MSARSVGLGAMFGWVGDTYRLVKRNFWPFSMASLVTIGAAFLFTLPILWVLFKAMPAGGVPTPDNPTGMDLGLFFTVYAGAIVVSLLLFPPMLVGWFRLCERIDSGATGSGTDILKPYADSGTWMRAVGFVLLATLMYAAVFAVVGLFFGGAFSGLIEMQVAQQAALATGQAPPPPDMAVLGAIMLMYVVVLPVMVLLQFVYMVGLTEVSLRSTPVLVAFKDALLAVLRNSLKLLLLMFCLGMAFSLVFFVLAMVFALLGFLLSMISPVLLVVMMVLLYIPLLLVMYPLMFAGNYMAWKSMLGSGPPSPPATPAAVAA